MISKIMLLTIISIVFLTDTLYAESAAFKKVSEFYYQNMPDHEYGDEGDPAKVKQAMKQLKALAAKGDADAQNLVGWEGATNEDESIKWLSLAAKQGHAMAQARMGTFYRIGKFVKRNDNEARRLFELSAKQGNMYALSELAMMYRDGEGGLIKNPQEFARLMLHVAENGACSGDPYDRQKGFNIPVFSVLEDAYKNGIGVQKNLKQAEEVSNYVCETRMHRSDYYEVE